MKKLTILLLIILSIPCFPALEKSRNLGGNDFSFHWLSNASFNRYKNVCNASYLLYKDKTTKDNNKHNYIKKYDVEIPFAAFTNTELLQIKTIVERATKRSIKNQYDVETNWYADALEVAE